MACYEHRLPELTVDFPLSVVILPFDFFRKDGLCRNPEFSTNGKAPGIGGDRACPPNRPGALRWRCITLSGIIVPERMPQRRGGGITCRRPRRGV